MAHRSPIYHLLHQEIRACAGHLLEMGQNPDLCIEKDASHILSRILDLHQFASKVRSSTHYQALYTLRHYLENTMLLYQDDENKPQTIRLCEAISILRLPSQSDLPFKPGIVNSLTSHCIRHFLEEAKPGRPLFKNLSDIKKL